MDAAAAISRWHQRPSLMATLCDFPQEEERWQLEFLSLTAPPAFLLTGQRQKKNDGEASPPCPPQSCVVIQRSYCAPVRSGRGRGWRGGLQIGGRFRVRAGPTNADCSVEVVERAPAECLFPPPCTNDHYEHLLNLQPADFLTKHPPPPSSPSPQRHTDDPLWRTMDAT